MPAWQGWNMPQMPGQRQGWGSAQPLGIGSGQKGGLAGGWGQTPQSQGAQPLSVMHTGPAVGLDLLRWGTSGQNPYGDAWAGSIYNPMGYQPYLDAIRQQGMSDAGGRMNALRLQNQVSGGDPYLNAYAALMGGMRGQSDTARLIGQAQLGQMQGAQDFYRQLLFQLMGGAYQMQGVDRQREMANKQANAGTVGALGQLGGGLIGAWGK